MNVKMIYLSIASFYLIWSIGNHSTFTIKVFEKVNVVNKKIKNLINALLKKI